MHQYLDANFTDDYHNEEKQCRHCDSLHEEQGRFFCGEYEIEVPLCGHCDFFRSRD
jgi:hypothetical protein